jgi:hypothetical protein
MPLRYFYDDDRTGKKNAIKKMEEGYEIFLWDKFKSEHGLPYKPPNGKKWDLNDAMIWFRNNEMKVPLWDKYFSNDPLDLIDL